MARNAGRLLTAGVFQSPWRHPMPVSLNHDDLAFCLLFGRQCRQHYGNEAWEHCVRKLRSCWAHVTEGRNLPWEAVESQVRLGWESVGGAEPSSLRWAGN